MAEDFKFKIRFDSADADRRLRELEQGAQQVTNELDQISGHADKMGSGVASGAAKAKKGIDGVKDSSDQSRSVLANMVGNSTQDLGQLGGVAGSAGVAVGQLAEYAVDGNIKLANLAKVVGPLLAVGVAVKVVSAGLADLAADAAADKAFRTEQVDAYVAALRTAGSEVQAIQDRLTKLGQIQLQINHMTVDVTDSLAKLGLTADEFSQLVAGGLPAINKWYAAMEEAGLGGTDLNRVMLAATGQSAAFEKAQKAAAITAAVFTTAIEDTVDATGKLDVSTSKLEEATGKAAGTTDRFRGELGSVEDAINAARDAQEKAAKATAAREAAERSLANYLLGQVDAQYAYYQSVLDSQDAVENYNAVLGDSESTSRDVARATDDALSSLKDIAKGYATAEGAVDGSRDSIELQIESLTNMKDTLVPGSPLYSAIEGFIGILKGVERDISIKFTVTGLDDLDRFTKPGASPPSRPKPKPGGELPTWALLAGDSAAPPPRNASPGASVAASTAGMTLDQLLAMWAAEQKVAEQKKKADDDAAKAADERAAAEKQGADDRRKLWDLQLEFGDISIREYQALLEGDLANQVKYSDAWIEDKRKLNGLAKDAADELAAQQKQSQQEAKDAADAARKAEEDAEKAHQDALLKIWRDAQNTRKADEAAVAAEEAANAVADAVYTSNQYGLDKKRTPAERADAAAAVQAALAKQADAQYSLADAMANKAGFDDGSPEWAQMVRAMLASATGNSPALAPFIEALLRGVPGRAGGGRVQKDGTYWVGEQGPELVTFGRDGTVTPNGGIGTGWTIVTQIMGNVYGNDHLRSLMDERDRRLQRSINAGRR